MTSKCVFRSRLWLKPSASWREVRCCNLREDTATCTLTQHRGAAIDDYRRHELVRSLCSPVAFEYAIDASCLAA